MSFGPPLVRVHPALRLMTMTDHNDVVVQNGRLFFGVKKAEGPAAGRPKGTYLVLGLQGAAAGK
ncbi:hypothetical protein L1856_32935 [Streptomyces sp. Tue 6430]|nr:hypothetical protein [Streptomyces sp. Tue 6430]